MPSRHVDGPLTPSLWQRPEPLYPPVIRVISALLRLVYDVRVAGGPVPRSGPVLFTANHVARTDAAMLAVVLFRRGRKTRFLAVSGLWSVPLLGWLLRKGRMVPVHRGAGTERMTHDACAALDAGEAVLVYPEGTIVPPGQQLPARPGAGQLALLSPGPVIPIAVWGLGRDPVVRRGARRRVGVAIGEPVDLSPWRTSTSPRRNLEAAAAVLEAVRALRLRAEHAARAR